MFPGSKVRLVRGADILTVICEPIVYTSGIFNISQPPRPITGIRLLYGLVVWKEHDVSEELLTSIFRAEILTE
jgi:hypothetical protein